MPSIKTGFDLQKEAMINLHFVRRKRRFRLELAINSNPGFTGYGIDEATALMVKK
jgi:cyanophycinase-like exopeptidase